MNKEKIAVVGSGISGLSASCILSKKYEVHLYEKNNYLGGHTRTKSIKDSSIIHNIDTGFIVFNNNNYPDLVKFFDYLNLETCNSNMSFSLSLKKPKLEYGSTGINSLFSDKKNLFSFSFWNLLIEIFKLYNQCKNLDKKLIQNLTLEDFLNNFNYSNKIRDLHIYPMVSCIWSCNKNNVKNFPLESFINFFENHKLFNFSKRHQWKYVKGGSNQYIKKLIKKNLFTYHLNKTVKKIIRSEKNNIIVLTDNRKEEFKKIILATHANQSMELLDNPNKEETNILSKFKYSKNNAYLHSDESFMPEKKSTWSSWNFKGSATKDNSFSLTYWMNLLQNLKSNKNYFVTINPISSPKNIYDYTTFEHPIFNLETIEAQKKIHSIQGFKNTWYCGSYCGYGFHEDGIQSAAYISELLGVTLPWKRSANHYNRLSYI